MAVQMPLLAPALEVSERDWATARDVPDAIWPSDNPLAVPVLNLAQQARAVSLPFVGWGSIARTTRMVGTYHFYTDDSRYDSLWRDPAPLLRSGAVTVVEPNFSIYDQMPLPVALYRIYQKRWLARYWQSYGVTVIADLNVAEPYAELNMLGIPDGWRAYATRGYDARTDATMAEWRLAVDRAGTDDLLFMVYGGGSRVAELCQQQYWLHIPERMSTVRVLRKAESWRKALAAVGDPLGVLAEAEEASHQLMPSNTRADTRTTPCPAVANVMLEPS